MFAPVNALINWMTQGYTAIVRRLSAVAWVAVVGFVGILAGTFFLLISVPTSFVPDEDQGYFFIAAQLPSGASLDRTKAVESKVLDVCNTMPEIVEVIEIAGYDFISSISQINSGFMVAVLKPWDERTGAGQSAGALIEQLNAELSRIPEAMVFAVNPPAIQGLGTVGGFDLRLQDLLQNLVLALQGLDLSFQPLQAWRHLPLHQLDDPFYPLPVLPVLHVDEIIVVFGKPSSKRCYLVELLDTRRSTQ